MLLNWDSHIGTYQHRCDSCGREFAGRKNQLYCDPRCKARYNNELAAMRRQREQLLVGDQLHNMKMLGKLIPKDSYEVVEVSMEKLRAMRFNPESANQRVTIAGELWFKIGPYGFRPIEASDKVELLNLEEDDTQIHR